LCLQPILLNRVNFERELLTKFCQLVNNLPTLSDPCGKAGGVTSFASIRLKFIARLRSENHHQVMTNASLSRQPNDQFRFRQQHIRI
jgi:hypothetical protein